MLFEGSVLLLFESALLWLCVMGQREEITAMTPTKLQQPSTQGFYFNDVNNFWLFCSASGQPKPVIQLLRHGDPFESKPLPTSELDTIRVKFVVTEGVYQCVANNSHGFARSDDITIKRVGIRTTYELLPGGHGVVLCDAVVDVKHLHPTYTWQKNAERVSVSDEHYIDVNGSLHILNMGSLDVGNYSCTINIAYENDTHTLNDSSLVNLPVLVSNSSFANPNGTASNKSAAFSSAKPFPQNVSIHVSATNPTQTPGVHGSGIYTSSTDPTHISGVYSHSTYKSSVKPTQTPGVFSSGILMSSSNPTQTASVHSSVISTSSINSTQTASVYSSVISTSSTNSTQTASVHSSVIPTSSINSTQTASVYSSVILTSSTNPTQTASVHSSAISTSSTNPTQTASVHSSEIHTSAIKPIQTASVHSSVHYTKYMDSTTQHTRAWSQISTRLEHTTRTTVDNIARRETSPSLPSTTSAPTKQPEQTRGPQTIMLTKTRTYTYGDNVTIECLCSGLRNNKHPNVSWTVPEPVKREMDIRSDKYKRRLVITNVNHNASGIYQCSCDNSSIKSINITIQANYMWVTKPIHVDVMAGGIASFTCDARWSDNVQRNRTITWYSNYGRIPHETGPMIEFRNVNRNRDIRNIQCRTESAHRSLYFNSYLQVIEPTKLSAERTNLSIKAENTDITLRVKLVTDPYLKSSETITWEHISENDDDIETLDEETVILSRYTDGNTTWEMLLGEYIFTLVNKYEKRTISFYVSRMSSEPNVRAPFEVNRYLGEILGLVTVVAVLIILCILYKERKWLKKKWQKRKLEQSIKFRLELAKYNHASRYVKFPAHSDEFPIDRLHFLDTLGAGNFGKVMKAEALDVSGTGKWDLVAVKMCKDIATDAEKENLYHETVIIRKVPPHINVVTYLGYVASSEPSLLIMEYVPGGNLLQFLRNRRPQKVKDDEEVTGEGTSGEREETGEDKEERKSEGNDTSEQMNILSSRDLSSFALQIAKGMAHIASQNIIHRDLAARNVLLGLGNVCKISDFGLSRDMEGSDEYEVSTMGPLPIRWMPPESLTDRLYTLKSDVWSYGVLLWEVVTLGASPYSGQSARQVMMSVKEGKRLEKPDYCSDHVYKLMTQCWRTHPGDRPAFSQLAETIAQHLEEEAEYVQLSNFDVNIYDVIDMGGMDVMEEKV